MTIESDLSSIAKSLELIANHLIANHVHTPTNPSPAPVVAVPVVAQAPVQVPNVAPTPAPAPAPIPVVTAPVAAPVVATASPSSMTKEAFMAEVMSTYKALGPVKGAGIQSVLTAHGAVNINDVKPEQYAAIVQAIKAL